MNNTAENDFLGFPKVKWLHLAGEVDKSVRFSCQIFSGFNVPEIIKIGYFLTELFKKLTVDVFSWDTVYICETSWFGARSGERGF